MKFKKNKGFTLLEVIITSTILLAVTPMLLAIIVNIQESTLFNIASSVQRSSDTSGFARVGRILNSSSKFIARNIDSTTGTELPPTQAKIDAPTTISQFYLKVLGIPSSYSFGGIIYKPLDITSRVLPVYDPSGTFSPTNVTPVTTQNVFNKDNVGNSIMNITIEDFLTYPYDINGNYLANSTLKRRFPLYQIHYFYLVSSDNPQFGMRRNKADTKMNGKNLLLVEWKSQYLLDYTDFSSFVNCSDCGFSGTFDLKTDSSTVLASFQTNMTAGNIVADFMPNIPIAVIIKQSETTYTTPTLTIPPIAFPIVGTLSAEIKNSILTGTEYGAGGLPMQAFENVLRYPSSGDNTSYGIAANNYNQDAGKNVTSGSVTDEARRVPFFKDTVPNNSVDGFPHGFEVMLSGTAGSTKVFMRMNSWATAKSVSSYNPSMITFQGKN